MDVILLVLGVLGLGAIVIAVYVFTVAARNYVAADESHPQQPSVRHHFVERQPTDRRRGGQVAFPLTVNGVTIARDRREHPERRLTGAMS